jgi:leader peptidase (prepilin peptidase) / N-methyltransferase
MTVVILFVLGIIVGSFLNVVGLRWDSGRSILGRSFCPHCRRTLSWWELVPIVSFFFLKAQCQGCQGKISWQYPLIEILTGLIFVTVFNFQTSLLENLFFFIILSIYVVILIYDLHHKIIPDELVYTSIVLIILFRLTTYYLLPTTFSLLDWLAGPIIFIFFGSIWLLSRGRAMGFGDAKLGLSIGLLLGAAQGFSAIIMAFWLGAGTALIYLALNKIGFLKDGKKLTMKSEIPFAPAMILGTWISIVFHLNILHVALF